MAEFIHHLANAQFILALPFMFGIFMTTMKMWPAMLYGMAAVALVAFDQGQLRTAAPWLISTIVIYFLARAWIRRGEPAQLTIDLIFTKRPR